MGHDGARSSPARFLFFRLLLFLQGYPAGTSAEERASKLVTRGQLFGRVTRNSQQLFIPLFKTAAGQRSFQYRVVSLWNSLDKDLKLSKNCRDFKQKLTQILLHKFLDPSNVSQVLTFYCTIRILNRNLGNLSFHFLGSCFYIYLIMNYSLYD